MHYPEYWEAIFELHDEMIKNTNKKVMHNKSQNIIKKIRGK